MAVNDVNITEIGGKAALPWATEATMSSLLDKVKDLYTVSDAELKKISASLSGGLSGGVTDPALLTAIRDLQTAITSNTNSPNRGGGPSGSPSPNPIPPSAGGLSDVADMLNQNSTPSFIKGTGAILNTTFTSLASVIGVTIPKFNSLGAAVAGVTKAFATKMVSDLINQSSMYTELYKSGLIFRTTQDQSVTSMEKFGNAADQIGITFGDLSTIMKNHSKVINRDGIKTFSEMADKFKLVGQAYGYTATESTEYLAAYIEQQRLSNTLNLMSESQIRTGADNQLKASMELARAFGLTTEEFESSKSKIANSLDLQTAMASLPDDIQRVSGDRIRTTLAAFETMGGQMGGEMSTLMMKAIAQPTTVAGEEMYQAFMMMGAGGNEAAARIREYGEHVRAGTDTQEEANELMRSIGNITKGMSEQDRATLQNYAQHNSNIRTLISLSGNYNQTLAAKQASEQSVRDGVVEKMTGFSSVFKKVQNIMESVTSALWKNSKFVDEISAAMDTVAKYLDKPETKLAIANFATTMVSYIPKIVEGIIGLAKFATDVIMPFVSSFIGVTPSNNESGNGGGGGGGGRGSMAVSERIAKAGEEWLLAFVSLKGLVKNSIISLFSGAGLLTPIKDGFTLILDAFKMPITSFGSWFKTLISPFTSVGNVIANLQSALQIGNASIKGIFAGFSKIFGPVGLIISGLIGMFRGLLEFNTEHLFGSIANVLLRTIQGVVMDGIVGVVNFLYTAVKMAISRIPGLNYFMDDKTKEQGFGEMMDATWMGQASSFVNKGFDQTANILTGNEPTNTAVPTQVVTEKHEQKAAQKKKEEADQQANNQQIEQNQQVVQINNKSHEQLVALNDQMENLISESRRQTEELKRLINKLPSSYNVG